MEKEIIRQEVRRVLREVLQQQKALYPVNGGNNQFPTYDDNSFVRLPEEINTKEEYLVNWEEASGNNDLYSFPMDEFVKGIKVEKAKNSIFNILDISKIVINNLENNPQFYTNLGV
jgi:hypothetical protein